jgi:hypothetical protein
MITDCHIHIQPMEMFNPQALELMKKKRPNFDQIVEFCRSPKAFLKFLDASGIDRAMLINYVAPEVIGFTNGVNQFVADYVKETRSGCCRAEACTPSTPPTCSPTWSRFCVSGCR